MVAAAWHPYADGTTIGGRGTEDGTILRDEEHDEGSRITLERTERFPKKPTVYAITCGIYGWMFHTRFLGSENEAVRDYEAMKGELAAILASIPFRDDPAGDEKMSAVAEQIGRFVERFP